MSQLNRTAKVYGAALYVAKRDVLADPNFSRYATLSSEELRNRDDFYEHLMNMPSPGEDPMKSLGGFFDRTLMVKTNMQLSTDAMRKSLEGMPQFVCSFTSLHCFALIFSPSFVSRLVLID